uniref:Uncharacterized protein LOC113790984 n=1 Tax=Dermatophagoides pteronyssinus TaxID=6956 RepID=A0A6P6XU84_DERPT|nr:uncharacterized protein LOC113790984 [Dermatophagoides pteronyssinus]
MSMIPGVLHLADCLDYCRQNQTCNSLNFETGLCVLLSSSAIQLPDALTPSQFPVFTIYAQKICLKDLQKICTNNHNGWAFERVAGFELREHEKRLVQSPTSQDCMQACVWEQKFQCRSINYESKTGECWLSDMNRHTVNINTEIRSQKYGPSSGNIDYYEFNCIQEPKKLCDFRPIHGRILKTVDSVYQNITTIDECQRQCLQGPYRCHSYDFGDPSNPVCRTSHLDKISLAHIDNPYIEIAGTSTFELQACYDVNIQCESREMVAKVRSSKIFDGKVYAKRKPYHCMTDVNESLEFEIHMGYNDLECDVQQTDRGQYTNDIVIQHHDLIVTTQDLGLNINCKYDLSNRSISNNVNLDITGNLQPIGTHSAVVDSPNVTMKIVDMDGSNVRTAKVGDQLVLRFEIIDQSTPYELFVRELIALDGTDMSEFVLIDSDGCPTDIAIMKPVLKSRDNSKTLETMFEAFKFPSSDIVQFKALITPCITNCEPINCNLNLPNGRTSQSISYGRRRRRRSPSMADVDDKQNVKSTDINDPRKNVIVVESLSVTDKFSVKDGQKRKKIQQNNNVDVYADFEDSTIDRLPRMELATTPCINVLSLMIFAVAFLCCQTLLIISWSYIWSKKRKNSLIENELIYGTLSSAASASNSQWSSPIKSINHRIPMAKASCGASSHSPASSSFVYSVPSRQHGYLS